MEALVDKIRKADEDNPLGYYEFERVKKIKEDDTWLDDATGKVFKMVSMLLYHLPLDRQYKIIMMMREMDEILASQSQMLDRLGYDRSGETDEEMGQLFHKHLGEIEKWLEKQDHMDVLYINYNDIIERPSTHIETINRFLGDRLDVEKMAEVVDRSLYRQRSKKEADSVR